MRKQYILAISLLSTIAYGQVGINTDTPAATLDIVGKPTETTTMDGIIAPRIQGAQLRAKTYTSAQTGALVYVTLADNAPAGQTIDVTKTGYYYFNGTKWVSTGASTFTADVRRIGTNHLSEDAGVGSNGTSIPGNHNIAIGEGAMKDAVDGGSFLGNIAIGGGDQLANITGAGNVAIGYANLPTSTSGTNVAVGPLNLQSATTADANFVVGAQNMNAVTTAGSNLVMGASNLNALTTGSNNYVFGFGGLNAITSQTQNIAIGAGVLPSATGDKNIGVGSTVLGTLGVGTDNVGLGVASGGALMSGNYNTFFGTEAGNRLAGLAADRYTSGDNSIFLGSQTKSLGGGSNQLNIQNYIYGQGGLFSFGDFTLGNALIAPSARLDVTKGNVRVRDINTASSTGTLTTDRFVVADGTGVLKTVATSGVDLIVGNEVVGPTTNGGLTRAGSGTTASPYTLGLSAGTTTGDLMTWNGTQWVSSAAVNIYNSDGTLSGPRTVTQAGNSLTFSNVQKTTFYNTAGIGIIQDSGTGTRSSIGLSNGGNYQIWLYSDINSNAQIFGTGTSTDLMVGTSGTTTAAPLRFNTSIGGGASGTEKMRITPTGNVGVSTTTPSEKFDNNGITRLRTLPVSGTANAIYTTSGGSASSAQDQTFTATKTVVADANGVLGSVTGLPVMTEVDGIVGNEVVNATTNGGLTRAGSGTGASPYTLGLTSGTTAGQLMTWNGTQWLPTAAVNLYSTDGALATNRIVNLNGKTLTFTGTDQNVNLNASGTLVVTGTGSNSAFMRLTTPDGNANGVRSFFDMQLYPDNVMQLFATDEVSGITFGTNATLNSSPLDFITSSGSTTSGVVRMRITGTGNIGINTIAPTEKFDNNGITRLRTLPLNGATNAINTNSSGNLSASQNQTFTATKTLVADANGVVGAITGVPLTTEVDGIVGNEVTDATTNGGLTRAGAGTLASPYTLGLSAGGTTGNVMTWNGTSWASAASANIYSTDGSLSNDRTLNTNNHYLNFTGTQMRTTWDPAGTLLQQGLSTSPSKYANMILLSPDNNSNGVNSRMHFQIYPESVAQIIASDDTTGLALSTNQTTASAPITFLTSTGSNALGTEKMRITGSGNVGINTTSPSSAARLHVVKTASDLTPAIIEGCNTYTDNAAAVTAGLPVGALYRKADGTLMVRY